MRFEDLAAVWDSLSRLQQLRILFIVYRRQFINFQAQLGETPRLVLKILFAVFVAGSASQIIHVQLHYIGNEIHYLATFCFFWSISVTMFRLRNSNFNVFRSAMITYLTTLIGICVFRAFYQQSFNPFMTFIPAFFVGASMSIALTILLRKITAEPPTLKI